MTYQRISATNLLRSTFGIVGSLYVPLLIITSPDLIGDWLNVLVNQDLDSAINGWKISGVVTWNNLIYYLNLIYRLCAVPLLSGATIFYTYQSLTGNQVTVGEAFKHAYRRLPQLMWLGFRLLYCFIYMCRRELSHNSSLLRFQRSHSWCLQA